MRWNFNVYYIIIIRILWDLSVMQSKCLGMWHDWNCFWNMCPRIFTKMNFSMISPETTYHDFLSHSRRCRCNGIVLTRIRLPAAIPEPKNKTSQTLRFCKSIDFCMFSSINSCEAIKLLIKTQWENDFLANWSNVAANAMRTSNFSKIINLWRQHLSKTIIFGEHRIIYNWK